MPKLSSKVIRSLKGRYKTYSIKLRALFKTIYQQSLNLDSPTNVIFIFGCQRSGTTFLENIFRHDLNSAVFGEFSELTIGERKTVLKENNAIREIITVQNAKYAVIRPLFESDRAKQLLDLFPNSIGIWVFRDCPHVVDSMIRKWDDKFFAISNEVESDIEGAWRLSQPLSKIINQLKTEPLHKVYAQYWMKRNQIPFNQNLTQDPRMLFLSYPQLAENPRETLKTILCKAKVANDVWTGFNARARISSIDRSVSFQLPTELKKETDSIYRNLLELSQQSFEI